MHFPFVYIYLLLCINLGFTVCMYNDADHDHLYISFNSKQYEWPLDIWCETSAMLRSDVILKSHTVYMEIMDMSLNCGQTAKDNSG